MSSNGLFINNGEKNKRVSPEEIEYYLSQGWRRGMKPRDKNTNEIANKKREETCLKKYGVKNVHQLNQVKEKTLQTCLKKYGVDNPAKSNIIKEKTKKTNAIKWPENKNYHNLDKQQNTLIKRYGSLKSFYEERNKHIDWKQSVEHQITTKRKNKTFNYSQPEEDLYKELCKQYGESNVLRNYKEERYPFMCDFYIPKEDLFIELNRHWTHGGHWFNSNDEKDIKKLNEWKEKAKTSKYMEYAILNWTVKDPLKKQTAEKNKLNYKVYW